MQPTELLADVPLANGQEQHNNNEGDVSDQSKLNSWLNALVLFAKNKEEKVGHVVSETLPPLID